jgi:D-alanyl-lipoteichoic acid acyltransferase DltB (MBOAT superfamily)
MLFNSASFLAAFAAFTVLYYAAPHRVRWPLLVAASVAFYATLGVRYLPLMVAVTLVAYAGGLAIDRARAASRRMGVLALAVAAIVGILGALKYVEAPGAPAGLSFYTFSCISYLADVYARRIQAERHAGYFATYVSFFPKLLAGPIERARPFLSQLRLPVAFSHSGVTEGLQRFLWGLFKKVVIADRLALLVDAAYGQASLASPADLLMATYFFAFQLYCDFSGYSDMAIGAAKILGFDLMENFRRPYLSATTGEFWSRRWHVSLTTWFRDYVYIPLGGNRVSRLRWGLNVMIVFLLSGVWHGAAWTFVIWGGLNGLFVLVSSVLTSRRSAARGQPGRARLALRRFATFHLILVTWVFFRAATLADAMTIFERVAASAARLPALVLPRLSAPDVLVALALIVLLMAVEWLDETRSMWERLAARPPFVRWAAYYALAAGLIVLGVWNVQRFVYMQF